MNENDLRDCFAMFALIGVKNTSNFEEQAKWCYEMADAMLEARKQKEKDDEEDVGIARVVPKRNYRRKS
jgi:hypothetical protein